MNGTDFAKEVGASLRKIRLRQGMSLQDVQVASGGRWKAAVVGAYERGDRSLSVARLFELAEFYGLQVSDALPAAPSTEEAAPPPSSVVINLDNLERVPAPERELLQRLVAGVQTARGDDPERRVSLREGDVKTLALLFGLRPDELTQRLDGWGLT